MSDNRNSKNIEENLKKKELILLIQNGKSDIWKDIAIVAEPDKNTGTENATPKKKIKFCRM